MWIRKDQNLKERDIVIVRTRIGKRWHSYLKKKIWEDEKGSAWDYRKSYPNERASVPELKPAGIWNQHFTWTIVDKNYNVITSFSAEFSDAEELTEMIWYNDVLGEVKLTDLEHCNFILRYSSDPQNEDLWQIAGGIKI